MNICNILDYFTQLLPLYNKFSKLVKKKTLLEWVRFAADMVKKASREFVCRMMHMELLTLVPHLLYLKNYVLFKFQFRNIAAPQVEYWSNCPIFHYI